MVKGTGLGKAKGEKNGRAKLTERQAAEVKRLVKDGTVSARRVARVLGLSDKTVYDLVHGINWKHLP